MKKRLHICWHVEGQPCIQEWKASGLIAESVHARGVGGVGDIGKDLYRLVSFFQGLAAILLVIVACCVFI